MPSVEMKKELEAMGFSSSGIKPCPKCKQPVDVWGKQTYNTAEHPSEPLALHLFSCGSPIEEVTHELPPIPGLMREGA